MPNPPVPTPPAAPCFSCRCSRFWLEPVSGKWVCGVCHPEPVQLVREWKKERFYAVQPDRA